MLLRSFFSVFFFYVIIFFLDTQCLIAVAESERIHSGIWLLVILLMYPGMTVAFLAAAHLDSRSPCKYTRPFLKVSNQLAFILYSYR